MKSCIIKFAIVVIFCFVGIASADDWKDESGKGRREKPQYRHNDRDHQKRPDKHGHGDHGRRPDYHNHHGYKERPYGQRRHYDRHHHNGHRYEYHGHWRSWKQWERYRKKHPHFYKQGHYYREDAHLMFRFCEPATGNCFFFSIGR